MERESDPTSAILGTISGKSQQDRVALHFMHYNFCRIHKSLRVTPAMEAEIADHVWSLEEVVALLD